ncbi:MAG: ABC transporter ATP-binding protein [Angelakisella sp.]
MLNWKVWKKLFPIVHPFRWTMVLIILLNLVLAAIDIAFPLFQRYAVDTFITTSNIQGLWPFVALYAGFILVQGVAVIFFIRLSVVVEMKLGRELKRRAFRHLQEVSLTYYGKNAVGYILARVMSDTGRIAGMISWGTVDLIWALTYVLGVLGVMLTLDWKLALLVMVVVPVVLLITAAFQGKIITTNRLVRSINSRITGAFNEGITGVKTIKSLVIEEQSGGDFKGLSTEMYKSSIAATRLSAIFVPIILFLGSVVTAMVLTSGGYMVMGDLMQLGTLSAFIAYALGILEPVQQIASIFGDVIATQVNVERVMSVIEEPCDITDSTSVVAKYGDCFDPKRENWEPITGEIEFKDVSFRYPGTEDYILEHFNLKIPAGTTVAIVGRTGAGKSTLVNLVCRFYEPTAGQILIDGVDYRERSQLWLHSQIGYVLQDPHLFSGTIRENLRYGRLDSTDEQLDAVAQLVSLNHVAAKLENGLDTNVGEGGSRLSSGERQLVSFARAIVGSPPIFVLDEATSSIDTETEQLIQRAITNILDGRTSFIIAHRLSTIQHADLILVIESGKIIESGSHAQLLEQQGVYYELCKLNNSR